MYLNVIKCLRLVLPIIKVLIFVANILCHLSWIWNPLKTYHCAFVVLSFNQRIVEIQDFSSFQTVTRWNDSTIFTVDKTWWHHNVLLYFKVIFVNILFRYSNNFLYRCSYLQFYFLYFVYLSFAFVPFYFIILFFQSIPFAVFCRLRY